MSNETHFHKEKTRGKLMVAVGLQEAAKLLFGLSAIAVLILTGKSLGAASGSNIEAILLILLVAVLALAGAALCMCILFGFGAMLEESVISRRTNEKILDLLTEQRSGDSEQAS